MKNLYSKVELIQLGKIGKCYGINGWLKVFSYTEKTENIFNYQPWLIKNINMKLTSIYIEKWKYNFNNIIIKIKNINYRNKAILLTNSKIFIDSKNLPILQNGYFYWKDLIGCKVVNIKGFTFGKVINIMETGSNDVLIIKPNLNIKNNIKEILIPFINNQVIKNINLNIKEIKVDWNISY